MTKKRKRAARKGRARAKISGLPAYTPLIDELAEKLSRLRRRSCETARRDIGLRSSAKDKREVFKGALCSWIDNTYTLVLEGLRNHLQYAIAEIGQSAPLPAFRWAEEQVSLALAHGLGYSRLQDDEAQLRVRLSSLGAVTKKSDERNKQSIEVMMADDGVLEWLREYSSEWVKLACDDPADGLWVLVEWRAPAWAVESDGRSVGERSTKEETENLLNCAAADLRTSLERASADAAAPLKQPSFTRRESAGLFLSPFDEIAGRLMYEAKRGKNGRISPSEYDRIALELDRKFKLTAELEGCGRQNLARWNKANSQKAIKTFAKAIQQRKPHTWTEEVRDGSAIKKISHFLPLKRIVTRRLSRAKSNWLKAHPKPASKPQP